MDAAEQDAAHFPLTDADRAAALRVAAVMLDEAQRLPVSSATRHWLDRLGRLIVQATRPMPAELSPPGATPEESRLRLV